MSVAARIPWKPALAALFLMIIAVTPSFAQDGSTSNAHSGLSHDLTLLLLALEHIDVWITMGIFLLCLWGIAALIAQILYPAGGLARVQSTSRWSIFWSSLILVTAIIPLYYLFNWFWLDYILIGIPFVVILFVSLVAAIGSGSARQ